MSDTIFKVSGTVGIEANLLYGDVEVTKGNDLAVNVGAFSYDIAGNRGSYAGSSNNAVATSDENYIYLDHDGVLQIVLDSVGWPDSPHLRLARVVADASRITHIYDERPVLAASSGSVGLCIITYPVDGDIRGGTTSASSNNDIGAIRFDAAGDGWNRINRKPPGNYKSGDVVFRIGYSFPASIGPNKEMKWKLEWSFFDYGDALPVSWQGNDIDVFDVSGQAADTYYYHDMAIPAASFDKTKDMMALKISRLGTEDDCTEHCYVHMQSLRYTGYLAQGQAGQ